MTLDWTLRRIPRHIWVRLVVTRRLEMEPGREWIYQGLVRRDAWRLGPIGFAVLRFPCRDIDDDCGTQRAFFRAEARSIRRASREQR